MKNKNADDTDPIATGLKDLPRILPVIIRVISLIRIPFPKFKQLLRDCLDLIEKMLVLDIRTT